MEILIAGVILIFTLETFFPAEAEVCIVDNGKTVCYGASEIRDEQGMLSDEFLESINFKWKPEPVCIKRDADKNCIDSEVMFDAQGKLRPEFLKRISE